MIAVKWVRILRPASFCWRGFFLLLLLAGPASAAPSATKAQLKDIDTLYKTSSGCIEYAENPTVSAQENRGYKKACDTFRRLEKKLNRQGFCITSLRHPVGRTSKDGKHCDPLEP